MPAILVYFQNMTDQNLSIEELFNSAVNIVRNLPKEGPIKPSDELKLKFYAHFKQATHGPNDTPKPKFYQLVESYKWDAWKKLGDMSKEDAKNNYIRQLKEVIDEIPSGEELGDIGEFRKILGDRSFDCCKSIVSFSPSKLDNDNVEKSCHNLTRLAFFNIVLTSKPPIISYVK